MIDLSMNLHRGQRAGTPQRPLGDARKRLHIGFVGRGKAPERHLREANEKALLQLLRRLGVRGPKQVKLDRASHEWRTPPDEAGLWQGGRFSVALSRRTAPAVKVVTG